MEGKKRRDARDFAAEAEDRSHKSMEGWYGIPADAIRNAAVRAASLVTGVTMVQAKMSLFIQADGKEQESGSDLVRIDSPGPIVDVRRARNKSGGTDLRARLRFDQWSAIVTIEFDLDQFDRASAVNLLMRAGKQVGILEGRPMSRNSCGLGFGTFTVADVQEVVTNG